MTTEFDPDAWLAEHRDLARAWRSSSIYAGDHLQALMKHANELATSHWAREGEVKEVYARLAAAQQEIARLRAHRPAAETFMHAAPGPLNIRQFGAVGDGVTDDTEAFRVAAREALIAEHIDKVCMYGHGCAAEALAELRAGHESQAGHPRYDLSLLLEAVEANARKLAGGA